MVSLKDIAAELDLSVGLVSKVLSGKMGTTGVSIDKREKILSTARARGFAPNRIATALRAGRVGTIGVFVHPWGEPGTEIAELFLRGFAETLSSSTYHLWLTYFERDSDVHREFEMTDIRRQTDALVVAGVPHPGLKPILNELNRNGLPVVVSEEDAEDFGLPNIRVDTYLQGRLPTDYLVSKGCRRIAQIAVMPSRLRGYQEAMRDAGLDTEGLIVKRHGWSTREGREGTRQLLASGVAFDSIVCQTDNQAMGAIQVLQEHNIRVPDQVRVIGVDDTPLCDISTVPISSVTSEARRIGSETCAAVLRRLEGKPVSSQYITPRLMLRASA